ncbi:MAG: sulfurtransferase complex subunit TusC [Rhodospirillales bacterium]|nr:sulfurtransferase complex subunit TusC [Rhodospirillales bacterium]MSP80272.1 sulfurtransferase complex subunit TusC [Rhodospirillales bacterium]
MSEEPVFDTQGVVKKFMYVNRRAPYGTIYPLEILESVLVAAAFEQDTSVAFLDDGVFQIKKGQDPKELGMKNFSPTFRALAGYDVEKLYVEKESMDARGLKVDDFVVKVRVVSAAELAKLMAEQDILITG